MQTVVTTAAVGADSFADRVLAAAAASFIFAVAIVVLVCAWKIWKGEFLKTL